MDHPAHRPRTQPDGWRDSQAFLIGLGMRVREQRRIRGVSRRVLSEMSGVSERYLAQLESGSGNISIVLLRDIALSLGLKLDELVSEDIPLPTRDEPVRACRIALVGLRGAGKSTLGYGLARTLDLPFVELNEEIERASGLPVREIFNLYGEEGYRRFEADALEAVADRHTRVVLAVAGGIVGDGEVYETLLRSFHTVWLKATAEEHMNRVRAQGDLRPMQGNPAAMRQLRKLLDDRNANYARAHFNVDTSGTTQDVALEKLVQMVKRHILKIAT
ncbi:MAG: helix-turn-helix transcriptional regulator [Anderseniella sp.]